MSISIRQEKLSQLLTEYELDAVALNPGPSLVYMTGLHFHLMERPVVALFTPHTPPVLILPELETAKLSHLDYEVQAFPYSEDVDKWPDAFKQGVQAAGLDGKLPIGIEATRIRFLELNFIQNALPKSQIIIPKGPVAKLRLLKDEDEINAMQKAASTAQDALEAALANLKIGMTEKEFAAELVMQLFRQGSGTQLPFQPIVSTGPNGANPHATPSGRKLAAGDLLVIDWGASVDGYYSDITRTFGVGEVNEEQEKIHKIVQEANAAARAIAKPGLPCGAVDKAARDVIENAGYGEFFIHRTGHGLGMEAHEEPYLRAGNPLPLEPGMTFTIEPGIYIPEQDGVRIEDDVFITEDGLRSLTTMPRELRIVG